MAYTEDDLKFLRKIGQIVDEPAPVKVAKVKTETPTPTTESEEQAMAIFLSNGVVVTLNSVDLSDHVTSATINRVFEELEVTSMGDSSRKYTKGLETSTITLDFLNDTATGEVLQTLQAAWGTTVPITLKQTSAAISATNPEYQTTVLVNNTTDINGAVGDISSQSITFTCNSPITVDVTV